MILYVSPKVAALYFILFCIILFMDIVLYYVMPFFSCLAGSTTLEFVRELTQHKGTWNCFALKAILK